MPNQTENWTYEEFHAFVMLYAANTDGHITREEEELIVPTLTASEYIRIKSVFMACDDADALDIIFSYNLESLDQANLNSFWFLPSREKNIWMLPGSNHCLLGSPF